MEYWDATRIQGLKQCPALFNLRYELGWRPKRPNIHLEFGGAFADALEFYYKSGQDMEATIQRALAVPLPPHPHKTRESLIRSIIWHTDTYQDNVYILADGKPAVELSFEIPVTDNITFCGYLDRVIDVEQSLFIVDQKTTTRSLSDYYFREFSNSEQVFMYSLAATAILRSPIRGIIIDSVQVLAEESHFKRKPFVKTAAQLDEWVEDTVETIESRPKNPVHNFTSCWKYGGCDFKDVCNASPKLRKLYLNDGFKLGAIWDPSKKR